MVSLLVTVTLG